MYSSFYCCIMPIWIFTLESFAPGSYLFLIFILVLLICMSYFLVQCFHYLAVSISLFVSKGIIRTCLSSILQQVSENISQSWAVTVISLILSVIILFWFSCISLFYKRERICFHDFFMSGIPLRSKLLSLLLIYLVCIGLMHFLCLFLQFL